MRACCRRARGNIIPVVRYGSKRNRVRLTRSRRLYVPMLTRSRLISAKRKENNIVEIDFLGVYPRCHMGVHVCVVRTHQHTHIHTLFRERTDSRFEREFRGFSSEVLNDTADIYTRARAIIITRTHTY